MRNIHVTTHYQGRPSGEKLITPGFYLEDDPALHGLADFLIETGRATATEFTVVNPVEVPPATSLEASEIDGSHNGGSVQETTSAERIVFQSPAVVSRDDLRVEEGGFPVISDPDLAEEDAEAEASTEEPTEEKPKGNKRK